MPDCEWAEMRDALPDFLHGNLDALGRAAVEAHVASCADCASELALLREVRAVLSREPAVNVARISAAVAGMPRRAVLGSMPQRGRRAAPAWRRPAAVAAGIAVLASAALLRLGGVLPANERGDTQRVVASATPAATPSGASTERSVRNDQTALLPAGADVARGASTPATAGSTGGAAEGQPAQAGFEIGDLAGLSASEIRVLLDDVAGLDALPAADPAPILPSVGGEV